MSNIRCGNCGFLNFISATSCKRCKAVFEEPSPEINQQFAPLPPVFQGGYQMAQWPQPAFQPYHLPTPIAPLPGVSKNGAANAGLWVLLTLSIAIAVGIGVVWKVGQRAPEITGWREYTPPDNSFTVQMPIKPYESVDSQPTPAGQLQTHIMMGDMKERGAYVLAYTEYPITSTPLPADTVLDLAAQGAVNRSGARMVSKRNITLDGYQGIEVEMYMPATKVPGGGKAVCRIYLALPRLYILFVGGQESSGIYESRAKFLDSFRIKRS